MRSSLAPLTLALACTAPAFASEGTFPAFEAVKWYNTPALDGEALKGKAVLVEVFRTW
jgi:hypothetical protein